MQAAVGLGIVPVRVPAPACGMTQPQPVRHVDHAGGRPVCIERGRLAAEVRRHDVLAQTGRARPTVAGRISMRCMIPAEQTGQTRSERPVRAW